MHRNGRYPIWLYDVDLTAKAHVPIRCQNDASGSGVEACKNIIWLMILRVLQTAEVSSTCVCVKLLYSVSFSVACAVSDHRSSHLMNAYSVNGCYWPHF